MKIGLALSGGGVRSASQLGIIKALHEKGIYPTIFAGTSGGSIVATLMSLGYEPDDVINKILKATTSGGIVDLAYSHILKGLLTHNIEGFVKGDKLEKIIYNLAKDKKIICPLGIVATDIDDGSEVIFSNTAINESHIEDSRFHLFNLSEKEISQIVRASCSVPAIFIPKEYRGYTLVDGGITNNLPSDLALAMGADKVISIDLGFSGKKRTEGIFDIAVMSVNVLMSRNVDNNKKDFGLYLNPSVYDVSVLESSKIMDCYQRGYEFGMKNMDKILSYLGSDVNVSI